MRPSRFIVGVFGACALLSAARPVAAQQVPSSSDRSDLIAGLRQSVPHLERAVALDIDHDGDLDVVASTSEELLVVWINDGQGHLTRQAPRAVPLGMTPASGIASDVPGDAQGAPPTPRHFGGLALVSLPWLPSIEDAGVAVTSTPPVRRTASRLGPARAPPCA